MIAWPVFGVMIHPLDDTIAAIASAPGGAPRGIVRMSGPESGACLQGMLPEGCLDKARGTAAITTELHIPPLAPLPADVYFWPTARSYTGQPAAEIHTLGSPPLLEHVLETLVAQGARLAEPGEFTMRAFLAGKIDLTQAEAVLGTIDAVGSRQLDAALIQLAGGLAGPLRSLRETLLELLAHLEAGFDFADEDLPFLEAGQLTGQLQQARCEIEDLAERMRARREAGDTIRVVLTGPPNAGKSSLFNALADDAGALVSNLPGTTRDYLCADLTLDGAACRLIDTAGIGEVSGAQAGDIDLAAQRIAREIVAEADVLVSCRDAAEGVEREMPLPRADEEAVTIDVRTKIDLADRAETPFSTVGTSVKTGQGIAELEDRIREAVAERRLGEGDVVVGTAVRCRESLRSAATALDRALALLADDEGEELVAAEMRDALDALGRVVGAVYTDDLLDRIFSRFCVGK